MRLIQIAGSAYQRHDVRPGKPSAVGTIERAATGSRAGNLEQRSFERGAPRRVQRRYNARGSELDLRPIFAASIIMRIQCGEAPADLAMYLERVGVRQSAVADSQLAFLGDDVRRETAFDCSKVEHVARRVGKDRSELRIRNSAALFLQPADSIDHVRHHGDRVDALRRRPTMTADTANRHAERNDTLMRMTHPIRSRLANPGQARNRRLTENLPQRRRDNMRPKASHFLARSEHKHQRAFELGRIEGSRRVEALRDKSLHVGGAAAVNSFAGSFELERLAFPSRLPVVRNGIDMSRNDQSIRPRRPNPRNQVSLRNPKQLGWLKRRAKPIALKLFRQILDRRQVALSANGV